MSQKLKHYTVSLDGLDKTGKSLLVKYLAKMSNYTLNILDRGPITNVVWNEIQGRDVEYDLEMWKSTIFVRLNVDKDDWKIRCSINNEPPMPHSFEDMSARYDIVFEQMRSSGFIVLEFNTSELTPYKIASEIMAKVNVLNQQPIK